MQFVQADRERHRRFIVLDILKWTGLQMDEGKEKRLMQNTLSIYEIHWVLGKSMPTMFSTMKK